MTLTTAQQKFVDLEKKKEEIKKYFKDLAEALAEVEKEVGVGGHFQDSDGTVFQVVIPEGKFVTFEKVSYIRTRRHHEKRGDLSLKQAQEWGYKVE